MDNVPEEIQLPDVCIYCEGSGTDHKHGEGRAHGDCCGVHGAIRIYSGSDAHQWVIDCYKGKNEALAATRQRLEAVTKEVTVAELKKCGCRALAAVNVVEAVNRLIAARAALAGTREGGA